jgi:hypothetical protein
MTHMFDIPDLKNKKKQTYEFTDNSTMGYIVNSKYFTLFNKIIEKSRLGPKLADKQYRCTLFAAPDSALRNKYSDEFFDNMDIGLANAIISYSTLPRIIDKKLITASPISIFYTENKFNKLCIKNISGKTILENNINILHFNHPTDNGLVHMVSDLLYPETIL